LDDSVKEIPKPNMYVKKNSSTGKFSP
jgi:hypothetical protein